MRFSKAKCKILHLGRSNLLYQCKLRDERIEHSPAEKDVLALVDGKLDMSQQCGLSPESQHYLVFHQMKCSQQVKRGEPAPLLCTGETSPGVLPSDLESSVKEGYAPVGAHPEEDHKSDSRDGTPLL